MNNVLKHRLFTSPDYSYQKNEEEDELINPMLDSFFSQKSQNTLKSISSPPKNIKLILRSDKKTQYIKPQQYYVQRDCLDIVNTKYVLIFDQISFILLLQFNHVYYFCCLKNFQNPFSRIYNIKSNQEKKYQQLDCLIPQIKLVQRNEKQRRIECFNGEEVTIDQKVYFNKCHEIRNIYYMTSIGYKLGIEEVEVEKEPQIQNSVSISEKMIKSIRAKKQFQKAKNKITHIKLVSEISKSLSDETKRQKIDREHSDHINQLLNDPSANVKNEHQLGELIGQTKVVTTQKNQEIYQTYQQPNNIELKKEKKVRIYLTKSLIIHVFCTLGILILIVILAYAKTINGFQLQNEDL